jgi:hypothetical protein
MMLAISVLGVFAAAYWTTRVACSLAEAVLTAGTDTDDEDDHDDEED